MLQILHRHNRLHLSILLVVFSLFSISLAVGRYAYTGQRHYLFMLWNLFLAWIPYLVSLYMLMRNGKFRYRLTVLPLLAGWLLFFPNAPYMLTDLLHLAPRPEIPLWYDLMLISSFAWTGLFLGLISLRDMQKVISWRSNTLTGWLFAFVAIALGSFGVFLGRYHRWNSWDIATNPFGLAKDIALMLLHPLQNPRTFIITALLTIFLSLGYLTLHFLSQNESPDKGRR